MQGLGMPRHTPQWTQQAQGYLEQAGQTTGAMDREQSHKQVTTQEAPGKTAGGALMSGGSGAMAGAYVGSTAGGAAAGGAAAGSTAGGATASGAAKGSKAGWWGAAIGAVVGLGAYLFS